MHMWSVNIVQASALSWNFKSCPEVSWNFLHVLNFCADVLKFLNTPVNGASVHGYTAQAFVSASGSGRPCPCEPRTQLWTLKTEGHTRTVILLKVWSKTTRLFYWFWETTVVLDDFNDSFSACLHGFMSWKMSLNFKIFLSLKIWLPRPA